MSSDTNEEPDFSLPPIENVVNEILTDRKDKEFYDEKYPSFSKRYPTLSQKIFEKDFDENIIKYMLNQMTKMNANKQTEKDASIKVGTLLVDTFVKPTLEKNQQS